MWTIRDELCSEGDAVHVATTIYGADSSLISRSRVWHRERTYHRGLRRGSKIARFSGVSVPSGPHPSGKGTRTRCMRGTQMTEVVPEDVPRKRLRSSQLGWAILLVMTLQALIFSSFGAWLATCAPQCGSSYPELGFGFFWTGALLFFVGLRASQGRRVSGAIA